LIYIKLDSKTISDKLNIVFGSIPCRRIGASKDTAQNAINAQRTLVEKAEQHLRGGYKVQQHALPVLKDIKIE
jgi:hypothetical protein